MELVRAGLDEGADRDTLAADLLLYCHGFCAALDGHHRSEDAALFPQIAAARPDLAPVLAKLSQDHSMMDHLIRGLEHSLTSGADSDTVLGHLEGLGAIMESHFGYEERSLLSVLDEIPLELTPADAFGAIAG
ncbi:hemerythrin domain-containing protein [Knoellia subterranea]|uniref:Cation-binding protein n=1 Tax=Knoellia subterranea KCTC 19937 TaxID=1385521 RepID=A0A0A0JPS6_9MICO|nr:hemerythrin domain-containing protein [Knoellia subterranea]KGN39163.1 cation-binding protein [Knoellia subterranea KCTC 19937]